MLTTPYVLPEDRERVSRASAACHAEKNRIYVQHAKVAKLAYMLDDQELRAASEEWQEAADLKVSTEYDCLHFEAQIRQAKKREQPSAALAAQLMRSRKLRDTAEADFPAKLERVKRLHALAVKRSAKPVRDGFF